MTAMKTKKREMKKPVDVTIARSGSMIGLTGMTPAGRNWIEANVESEGWQWMGATLWIEMRLAVDIVQGMIEATLIVRNG